MSKGNVNPVGVQEEQENNLIIPIFTRQLGEFFEVVQVKLPGNLEIKKLKVSYNGHIYILDGKITLEELINKLKKITTHEDYRKFIDEIAPDVLLVDELIHENEDDP
ncbi:MAG: hypothetical protein ACP5G1_04120 [Nanopusillaceae archaeon]